MQLHQVCIPTPDTCLLLPSQLAPMAKAAFLSVYGGLVPLRFSYSSKPATIFVFIILPHRPNFSNLFLLNFCAAHAIMALSTGETGATPVRDRRRKAPTVTALIWIPQSEKLPLDTRLRRLSCDAPKPEYLF
jgi:hypothetical protein